MVMKVDPNPIQHFYYHLDDTRPVEVLHHIHDGFTGWFDMHYELEMGIVLSGQMRRSYEGREVDLSAGEVWFCNMWEPHGFRITEPPCEVIVFEIFPPFLHLKTLNYNWLFPFNSTVANRPQVLKPDREEVLDVCDKIRRELQAGQQDQVRMQLFLFQLVHLISRHSASEQAMHHEEGLSGQHRITPAMELVFSERRFIPLEEAAQACAMSKNGFAVHFGKLMKTTFPKFALHYRIRGALHEHSHSGKTLEAIAHDWGFTDASHLHKYLKKRA